MHLSRGILVMLVVAGLAGCADVEDPTDDTGASEDPSLLAAGLETSHPAYGFPTHESLPEAPEAGVLYKDVDGRRVWYATPYRGLPDQVAGLEPLARVEGVSEGHGITTFAGLAVTGGTGSSMQVVDLSDPAAPEVIGTSDDSPVRDAGTILFPDGRLIVISTAGGAEITATDITDPTDPRIVGTITTSGSNHNIAVVPGSPIVYNSGQDIIDFSRPDNPVEVGNFDEGGGCHDIAFSINRTAERYWALCAGYAETEIWDIEDATAPELVVKIPYTATQGVPVVGSDLPTSVAGQNVPRVPGTLSHLAIVNHDATVLIMGDETGGGAANGCDVYYEGPDGETMSGPLGNLWFYDITDPQDPQLRGHLSPSYTDADPPGTDPNNPTAVNTGSCTAHFGEVVGRTDTVVMSYYTAGLLLIDFSDLDNPRIVDRWDEGGDIWDVQFHQGYLVTGDMARGMDVLALS